MARGDNVHLAATAWHEAGHALAAMREGRTVILAEISRSAPGAGRTIHFPFASKNRFNPVLGPGNAKASWQDTLDRRLANVRILLAGPLAEAKAMNQPLRAIGADSDLAQCRQIAISLGRLHEFIDLEARIGYVSPDGLLNDQRLRVRRWLGRPETWRSVGKIADALITNGSVGSAEIIRAYLDARSEIQRPLDLDWKLVPGR